MDVIIHKLTQTGNNYAILVTVSPDELTEWDTASLNRMMQHGSEVEHQYDRTALLQILERVNKRSQFLYERQFHQGEV